MAGVQNKNSKIRKECMDIVSELLDDLQEDLFTSKDVKVIIKEVDSKDKNSRSSALEACVSIYKLIEEKFWSMAGKNINLKVKDLITTKIASIPKDQIGRKAVKKKPKIVVKHVTQTEEKKEKPVAPVTSQRLSQLPRPTKGILSGNKSLNVSCNSLEESKTSKAANNQGSANAKTFKKFIRKDQQKKTFVKPSLSKSLKKPSKAPTAAAHKEEEEYDCKHFDENVTEAILDAQPVEEIVDFKNLDKIGKIINVILSGTVEEKFESLVLFNDIIATSLSRYAKNLIDNAQFISRTFSDVLKIKIS